VYIEGGVLLCNFFNKKCSNISPVIL